MQRRAHTVTGKHENSVEVCFFPKEGNPLTPVKHDILCMQQ